MCSPTACTKMATQPSTIHVHVEKLISKNKTKNKNFDRYIYYQNRILTPQMEHYIFCELLTVIFP